jgi:hypothetical protein
LRFFLPELPSLANLLDVDVLCLCNSLFILLFTMPWCESLWLVRGWDRETGLIRRVTCCSLLTSLAYVDVMSWLGSMVMGSDCVGVVAILILEIALGYIGGSGSVVRTCPFSLLWFEVVVVLSLCSGGL